MNTHAVTKSESRLNQIRTEIHEGGSLVCPLLSRVAKRQYNGTREGKCARAWWAGSDMHSIVAAENTKARRGY